MRTIGLAISLCLAVAGVGAPVSARSAESAPPSEQGRVLFQSRCGGCHALDGNKTGPSLRGVAGRRAGSVSTFRYSSPLARSGLIWTDDALDQWLAGPSKLVPGVRMSARITAPADRLAVIAYLRSVDR
jgi:cytochrome c